MGTEPGNVAAALKAKLDALVKDAEEAEEKAVVARRRARAARTFLEEEQMTAALEKATVAPTPSSPALVSTASVLAGRCPIGPSLLSLSPVAARYCCPPLSSYRIPPPPRNTDEPPLSPPPPHRRPTSQVSPGDRHPGAPLVLTGYTMPLASCHRATAPSRARTPCGDRATSVPGARVTRALARGLPGRGLAKPFGRSRVAGRHALWAVAPGRTRPSTAPGFLFVLNSRKPFKVLKFIETYRNVQKWKK
jgi:hypothetical protein